MSKADMLKMKAILFDSTRCIGCRSCEEACDEHNAAIKRKWSEKEQPGFRQPPPGLSADKWVHISYHELPLPAGEKRKPFNWDEAPDLALEKHFNYVRHACMHCVEPACANACIVGALQKQESGAVIYDRSKCMGCRYCMIACPFGVPKWEWHKALPYIRKCTMCHDLQAKGEVPACVDNCPGNDDGPALMFGSRYDLLYEAERRIHAERDRYYPHVFGRDELGGTCVLYIWDKRLTAQSIGFPGRLGKRSIPDYSASPISTVPYWVGGFAALFSGLNWVIKRRDKLMAEVECGKEDILKKAAQKDQKTKQRSGK